METGPKDDAERRSIAAATKTERARDGAQARQEYEAEKLAVQANTARLRALRLAKEAETSRQPPAKKTAVRRTPGATRSGRKPQTAS